METSTKTSAAHYKPPFIYRAASDDTESDGSRGINTVFEIDPLYGTGLSYRKSVADIPLSESAMIYDHLNYEYDSPSEFSSCLGTKSGGQSRILIYVMDTATLPDDRIRYAPELIKDYKLEWAHLEPYAQGEYLIHGRLENVNGLWKAVPLDDLCKVGLWDAFPGWWRERHADNMYQRVFQLRRGYWSEIEGEENVRNLPYDGAAEIFLSISKCFGTEWQGVVMFALIMFRRRKLDTENIRNMIERLRRENIQLPTLPRPSEEASAKALRTMKFLWTRVSEARQFMDLLRLFDDMDRQGDAVDKT